MSITNLYEQKLTDDFTFFLSELWAFAMPKHKLTFSQLGFARWLQFGPKHRGGNAYREMAKTWITAAYCLWRLRNKPNVEKIKLVSESKDHSRKTLLLMRQWIDHIDFLKVLAPLHGSGCKHRDSGDAFDVGPCTPVAAPSVNANGIDGQITGGRATIVVADDVETNKNTLTQYQRNALKESVTELEYMSIEGEVIYLGTPHHEETLYDHLAKCGYTFRSWPIIYPAPGDDVPWLAPELKDRMDRGLAKEGDIVDTTRFTKSAIADLELRAGPSSFRRQMRLMRSSADLDKYPLKQRDLIVFDATRDKAPASLAWGIQTNRGSTLVDDIPVVGFPGDHLYAPVMVDEQWLEYHGCKGYIDPAGSGKDEMAWAIVAQLHGFLYIKHVGAISGTGPKATQENLERIVRSLREHACTEVCIESNFGGDILAILLKPIIQRFTLAPIGDKTGLATDPSFPNGWSCTIITQHASIQKEVRIIDTLEPVMNQHRLVVSRSVARDTILMTQMTRLTKDRGCLDHDDRIDSVSGAVSLWRDVLDQDPTRLSALREQERKDAELRAYQEEMELAGTSSRSDTWTGL
jgi:hypothetical protein